MFDSWQIHLQNMSTILIYCGKIIEAEVGVVVPQGKADLACTIVMKLLQGLKDNEHCMVMINHFSIIGIFKELDTYAIIWV